MDTAVVAMSTAPLATGEPVFRFYDNRQKYLLFVNTCSEKWVVAQRVAMELGNIYPRPPAIRIFDAGVGDGTVLTRVMRAMHQRFPTLPSYIVGKEISLEDVRLVLDKMPDRLFEHPATVLVMTNMYYSEAPWLVPNSMAAATGLMWHEVALTGTTAHEFEQQITDLQPFLSEHWRARISPRSGNPIYDRPVVLVVYRDDHKFLLDQVRPRRGAAIADYDLVFPRSIDRAPAEFRAKRILAPLTGSGARSYERRPAPSSMMSRSRGRCMCSPSSSGSAGRDGYHGGAAAVRAGDVGPDRLVVFEAIERRVAWPRGPPR